LEILSRCEECGERESGVEGKRHFLAIFAGLGERKKSKDPFLVYHNYKTPEKQKRLHYYGNYVNKCY